MTRPWPRWAGALAGFVFLALFVCLPPLHKAGYSLAALRALLVPGAMSGVVGALVGWGLVLVRNRLMVQP